MLNLLKTKHSNLNFIICSLAFLTLVFFGEPSSSQKNSSPDFNLAHCDFYLLPPHSFDKNWRELVPIWKQLIETAFNAREYDLWTARLSKVSEFASYLIQQKRTRDLIELASLIEFPMEISQFVPAMDEPIFFGKDLLSEAILTGDPDLIDQVTQLPLTSQWTRFRSVRLTMWTQKLVYKVILHPILFQKLRDHLPINGVPFDPNMADFGYITPSRYRALVELSQSLNPDIETLFSILTPIFPKGHIEGQFSHQNHGRVKLSQGKMIFQTSGPLKRNSWLQIKLLDSAKYHQGMFNFTSYYKTVSKWNLQISTTADSTSGRRQSNEDHRINWVRQMKVEPSGITILLERDKNGRFYDRGNQYQELILNTESDGRIYSITIRSGQNILFRPIWASQTIMLPKEYFAHEDVYLSGEAGFSVHPMGR